VCVGKGAKIPVESIQMTQIKSSRKEGDMTQLTGTTDALTRLVFTIVHGDETTGAIPDTPWNVHLIHVRGFVNAFAIQAKHRSGELTSGVLGDYGNS